MNNETERAAFAEWATRENKYHTSGYNPCSDVELAFQAGAEWQRSLAQAELAELKAQVPVAEVDKTVPSAEIQWTDHGEEMCLPHGTKLYAAPSQPQSDGVMVPRELLMELRDAANECQNLSLRKYRTDFFEGLTKSADALLGGDQPAQPLEDPLEWSRKHGIEEF
jgi:hypothetical protein